MLRRTKEREVGDIWFATYLHCRKIHYKKTRKNERNFLVFIFDETEDFKAEENEFLSGTPMVNAKEFVSIYRSLKNMTY